VAEVKGVRSARTSVRLDPYSMKARKGFRTTTMLTGRIPLTRVRKRALRGI